MAGRGTTFLQTDTDEHAKLRTELKAMIKEAIESHVNKDDRTVSAYIQKKCDEQFGPTWHCIVGEDFKCAFTHVSKHFMLLTAGKVNVLLYKSAR